MQYDEDGDPIALPPEMLNLPRLGEDEAIILGVRVERVINRSVTKWGVFVPAIEATLQTTQGPLRTFWTRAEAAQLAEGLRSVLCDG